MSSASMSDENKLYQVFCNISAHLREKNNIRANDGINIYQYSVSMLWVPSLRALIGLPGSN